MVVMVVVTGGSGTEALMVERTVTGRWCKVTVQSDCTQCSLSLLTLVSLQVPVLAAPPDPLSCQDTPDLTAGSIS